MAKSGRAKKHVFCSDGRVAGKGSKTLARVGGLGVMRVCGKFALQLMARSYRDLPSEPAQSASDGSGLA